MKTKCRNGEATCTQFGNQKRTERQTNNNWIFNEFNVDLIGSVLQISVSRSVRYLWACALAAQQNKTHSHAECAAMDWALITCNYCNRNSHVARQWARACVRGALSRSWNEMTAGVSTAKPFTICQCLASAVTMLGKVISAENQYLIRVWGSSTAARRYGNLWTMAHSVTLAEGRPHFDKSTRYERKSTSIAIANRGRSVRGVRQAHK